MHMSIYKYRQYTCVLRLTYTLYLAFCGVSLCVLIWIRNARPGAAPTGSFRFKVHFVGKKQQVSSFDCVQNPLHPILVGSSESLRGQHGSRTAWYAKIYRSMRVFWTSVPLDLVWAKRLSLCSPYFFQWQEPRLPRATEVWQAKDLERVTFRDRTNLVVDFGCKKEHRLRSKRPKGTTMDGLIFPASMSDVHTLQDSKLYWLFEPKAGVLHVTVKSWDLCQKLRLKFQTWDIHKPPWTGPVAGSSIFPNDGHFIGHLESLGQEFGQVPVPWNGAWKHGRFETQSLLQRNSENGLNSLTGSLWICFSWSCNMKSYERELKQIHEFREFGSHVCFDLSLPVPQRGATAGELLHDGGKVLKI